MKNILLISPDSDNEALWVSGEDGPCDNVRNNMVPLGLATVAGLTPADDFHVDIWDELVHGLITDETMLSREYDLVGLTGYKAHQRRCREVAAIFRQRKIPTAIGGPGVSSSPYEYRDDFDILFIGEVEKTWPQFLRDWTASKHKAEYRQIEKPDLTESPLPKWDSIAGDLQKYAMGCVQTTRGCPFDCEFCDVIYLFGRRARHKPIANILEEVKALERLGLSTIFFCDDEFIGDPKYTKEMLRQLIPINNSFAKPLAYSTQLTMNLSKDEELLRLMADANFNLVFIGIETPNIKSLKETHKYQNIRNDLIADVHKILSYGIAIRAGIIVGFDNDDLGIFDMQFEFIQNACLPSLAINMLKAPLGTKLWSRLRQEGRVVSLVNIQGKGHPRTYTNILPKSMSRVELLRGYRELLVRVCEWENFVARIRGFVSLVRHRPNVPVRLVPDEDLALLVAGLNLESDVSQSLAGLIEHTKKTAPFMMRRVRQLIVQHAKYLQTLAKLLEQIDRQLELELDENLVLQPDNRAIVISQSFRNSFREMFPPVYRRVYMNIGDKNLVPQALTEVFLDFLVRWSDSFERLEPYHMEFLNEICDRTCANLNGTKPEKFVPVVSTDLPIPDVKRSRLADDVFMSVDQELLKFIKMRSRTSQKAQSGR
jgi:radical SAM family protein/uncharacterized protein DUF4070/B12 binding protein